jgi:hypothetical protein
MEMKKQVIEKLEKAGHSNPETGAHNVNVEEMSGYRPTWGSSSAPHSRPSDEYDLDMVYSNISGDRQFQRAVDQFLQAIDTATGQMDIPLNNPIFKHLKDAYRGKSRLSGLAKLIDVAGDMGLLNTSLVRNLYKQMERLYIKDNRESGFKSTWKDFLGYLSFMYP